MNALPDDEKFRKIAAIRNGTVIDHIPAGRVLEVVRVLKGDVMGKSMSIATNVDSESSGRKDLLKIENRELSDTEANKIAILAPNATVSTIRDYKVTDKKGVKLPEFIVNIVKCGNPKCITRNEPGVNSKFSVVNDKVLELRCFYCEKDMNEAQIQKRI
ncbi:MAG: aspartate carbamoyltransferase regulatory subunit [Candidatus Diapherotrites archaeon]|nr:aspartate carbamoyltransferase regulatory subunit [Candidatus Diapherotrites archaeon]